MQGKVGRKSSPVEAPVRFEGLFGLHGAGEAAISPGAERALARTWCLMLTGLPGPCGPDPATRKTLPVSRWATYWGAAAVADLGFFYLLIF